MPSPFAWMNNLLGTGSDAPVRGNPPLSATPVGPLVSQVAVANSAVTAFAAGTITHVADVVNPTTATEPLYVDIVAPAAAGSATSVPLLPGQAYRISGPISTAVSVVAATAGHAFVALKF